MLDEIPSSWTRSFLGKIGKWSGGGTPSKGNKSFWTNGTIPWVSPKDMKYRLISDAEDYITEEAVKQSSTKVYPAGAILIVTRSGILRKEVPVAVAMRSVAVNQDIKVFLPEKNIDTQYVANYLWGQNQHLLFRCAKDGTTVESIDTTALMSFPILIPPLPEQQKIAQILSTWDKAIEKLEAMIAAKQKRKKALMQQLLTGNKRFEGFDGKWKNFHLKDVAQILVSPVDKKSIEGEKPVLLCNYTDVYYSTRITKSLAFMPATATEHEISKFKLKKGDVIITKDSETPGDIAIPAFVSEELGEVVCGYHLAILRPKKGKVDGEFLNYLLSMQKTRYYFFTLATGATRFGLSVGSIEKAHFHLPPIDEQQKIASVLSAADKEVENHQKQLSTLKQQKKGLMQQLLTGNKRVKTEV